MRTVKYSVLPVLATEQPPCYTTQSSCLVEHIIRLCHQLQQNVSTCNTVVLFCHTVALNQWWASCGSKPRKQEFFSSVIVMSNTKKVFNTDSSASTIITVTDTDCIPAWAVLERLPSSCWWGYCAACQNTQSSGHYWTVVPVTSDSCNPKRTVSAMPGKPAAWPVGIRHCIFTVSSVCHLFLQKHHRPRFLCTDTIPKTAKSSAILNWNWILQLNSTLCRLQLVFKMASMRGVTL